MNLTNSQITQIKDYAEALLSASEISILVDFTPDEAIEFEEIVKSYTTSEIYKAFHTGRLKTKYELRKIVIKFALNGSPAAQPLAEKYLNDK